MVYSFEELKYFNDSFGFGCDPYINLWIWVLVAGQEFLLSSQYNSKNAQHLKLSIN